MHYYVVCAVFVYTPYIQTQQAMFAVALDTSKGSYPFEIYCAHKIDVYISHTHTHTRTHTHAHIYTHTHTHTHNMHTYNGDYK